MDTNFAVLVAPLGCFIRSGGRVSFQRDSQAFHADPRRDDSRIARKVVLNAILRSLRLDTRVIAAIESYFYRFEEVRNWHILRDDQKTAMVTRFYANVKYTSADVTDAIASCKINEVDSGVAKSE